MWLADSDWETLGIWNFAPESSSLHPGATIVTAYRVDDWSMAKSKGIAAAVKPDSWDKRIAPRCIFPNTKEAARISQGVSYHPG